MAVDLAILKSGCFLGGGWFLLYFCFCTFSSLYMAQILGIQVQATPDVLLIRAKHLLYFLEKNIKMLFAFQQHQESPAGISIMSSYISHSARGEP